MKKVLLLIFLFFPLSANADMILYGEADYNVSKALDEVKKDVTRNINLKKFYPYLVDINRKENITCLLSGQIELKDRELALFSNGAYGVVYKNNPLYAYYYSVSGILEYIDIRTQKEYPYKSYQYDINGNLVNMGLRLSKRETYIYSPSGELIAHWVGENGYNSNGNIIMKRKFIE